MGGPLLRRGLKFQLNNKKNNGNSELSEFSQIWFKVADFLIIFTTFKIDERYSRFFSFFPFPPDNRLWILIRY